jgi:hypothetical protein
MSIAFITHSLVPRELSGSRKLQTFQDLGMRLAENGIGLSSVTRSHTD